MKLRSGVIASWIFCACVTLAAADEPLHVQVDRLIAAQFADRTPAPLADDAAFLRRIWLDLAGRIPSAEQTERFLQDAAPDKRARMIDQLLAADTYAPRMQQLMHVMWMERRGDDEHWQRFLHDAFAENRPYDQMVSDMLAPDDEDESRRGAAFFYSKRLEKYGQNPVDYPGLTRDVGRLLMGVDLQCAECHDHLFIDDYKQIDFQGLLAIFQNLSLRQNSKFPAIDEKPVDKPIEFVSVFDTTQQSTGPRLPFAAPLSIEQPADDASNRSALAALADTLPSADNPLFARNAVNRLWFVMMGRGLVWPLDLHHSDNPPSHSELMELLAREFVQHDFDIKWLLRELALTDTYQRSSMHPHEPASAEQTAYLAAQEKRLSAEQLLASTLQAVGPRETMDAPAGDDERVKELKDRFMTALTNEPREPEDVYQATVKAALFQLNDDRFLKLLEPAEGNLMHRLLAMDDDERLIDELMLSVFSRRATEEERVELSDYLAHNVEQRELAVRRLAWAMLTSIEFNINH